MNAHAAPRQARERVTAGRQQIQRRPVSGDVDDDIGQRAGELLMVGPAQSAGRHPHQRIIVAEVREWKLPTTRRRSASSTNATAPCDIPAQ